MPNPAESPHELKPPHRRKSSNRVIVALVGFLSAVTGSVLGPIVDHWFEPVSREQLQQELDQTRKDYHDVMVGNFGWGTGSQRRISFQLMAVEDQIQKHKAEDVPPVLEILGINATGPIHQGRESIIKILRTGGKVRVLFVNPMSNQFKGRERFEHDSTGRIAAELNATLYILSDIVRQVGVTNGANLEVRAMDFVPDRSLLLVDACAANISIKDTIRPGCYRSGVILGNYYSSTEGTRGLKGESFRADSGEQPKVYSDNVRYFNKLWNESLNGGITLPIEAYRFETWPPK